MMLDATKGDVQRVLLEKELESVGIRLNRKKPNIYFKVNTFLLFCSLLSNSQCRFIVYKVERPCVVTICVLILTAQERWWTRFQRRLPADQSR